MKILTGSWRKTLYGEISWIQIRHAEQLRLRWFNEGRRGCGHSTPDLRRQEAEADTVHCPNATKIPSFVRATN